MLRISNTNAGGYQICEAATKPFRTGQRNIFPCDQNEFVSSSFVLDGIQDCTAGFPDKKDEMCLSQEFDCPHKCEDKSCMCSPLQFKSITSECKSFTMAAKTRPGKQTQKNMNSKENKRDDNIAVDSDVENNVVAECHAVGFMLNQTKVPCHVPGMLSCGYGQTQCHSIFSICIYELNKFKNLVPCRSGSHLQSCDQFQCNMHFKCPNFYCVPWSYVCDTVWDCLHGSDENEEHNCGESRLCKQMLKCRKSQICVHIGDMCNDVPNCPENDDELLCELLHTVCPIDCICLNFAIYCNGTSGHYTNSYISYHITQSAIQDLHFLRNNLNIEIMHFIANSIVEICIVTSLLHHVNLINFASNQIEELSQNCFNGLHILNEVVLKDNQLHRVEEESFFNIGTINLIDLSQNDIHSFSSSSFSNVSGIMRLKISNNPLSNLAFGSIADLLITHISVHAYYLCCVKPDNTDCDTTSEEKHRTCTDIFPTTPVKFTTFLVIIFILLPNIFSSLTFILGYNVSGSDKTGTNSKPFKLLTTAMNIGNFACGFYLTVLVGIDIYFADQIIYKEQDWGKSLLCLFDNMVCLFYCVSLSFFLCLMSVARWSVVAHPLKSHYKRTGYVTTQIVFSFSVIGVVCIGTSVISWVQSSNTQMPDKLCSPFADPTESVVEKAITMIVLTYQIIAAFVMSVMYCLLMMSLADIQGKLKSGQMHRRQVFFRVTSQTVTHVALCLSSSAIYATALFLPESSSNLVAWNTAVVFALPAVFIHLLLAPPSQFCKCC